MTKIACGWGNVNYILHDAVIFSTLLPRYSSKDNHEKHPTPKIGKVNVDEQPELAAAFDIQNIPTLVVVKGGKVLARKVGVQSKASILVMLNQ